MRAVLAILLGALVAVIVIWLMTGVAHLFYPGSFAVAALAGPGEFADPLSQVPLRAKATLVIGWFLGALAGAGTTNIATGQGYMGWVVAGLVVLYGLLLSILYPHPTWMALCAVVLPLLAGYVARKATNVKLR
ncbi:MAG: hypothetical protein PGN09_11015 [Sphingomonas fennica]